MALDRTAMERVLARAAELQTAAGASSDGTGLSDAELLDAAREAGLSTDHVRVALAEERLRASAPTDAGTSDDLATRVAGPANAAAVRLLAGTPATVLDALGRWLEREECMRLARRTADASGAYAAWDARTDFVGNLARGLRGGGGTPGLRRARGLRAVALPAEGGRTLLRLELDLGGARRQRLTAGGVAAGGGVLAGGSMLGVGAVAHAMLAVVAPVAVIPILAGGVAAWAIARGHRDAVARGSAALETILDRVEAEGGTAPSLGPGGSRAVGLLDAIDGVRRALR